MAANPSTLRDRCCIVGIGESEFSKGSGVSINSLNLQASKRAIDDAGLTPKDIDGVMTPAITSSGAEDFGNNFGIKDIKISGTMVLGGAGPVASLESAILAINAGIVTTVLVSFGCNGYSETRLGRLAEPQGGGDVGFYTKNYHEPYGMLSPASMFALWVTRYMYEFGWKDTRPLGMISVAQRKHAGLNEKAMMRKPITLEDHQNSRIIANPIRLLDCGLETDGAGAVVVTSAERAKELKQPPVYIMGVGQGRPTFPSPHTHRPDFLAWSHSLIAPRVFAMAGVTHKDIDFAELYDGFNYFSVRQLEEMGFCKRGEFAAWVEGGSKIEIGGELPINTHGGLLSHAHIWGINHLIEGVRQLRGQAGAAQVKDAEIGLVTGYGDFGDGAIVILRR